MEMFLFLRVKRYFNEILNFRHFFHSFVRELSRQKNVKTKYVMTKQEIKLFVISFSQWYLQHFQYNEF